MKSDLQGLHTETRSPQTGFAHPMVTTFASGTSSTRKLTVFRAPYSPTHTHTHPRHGHDTHQRSGQRRRSRNQVHNDRFLASRRLTATLIKLSNRSFSPHHHHTPTVSWALRGLQKEPSELHAYIAATSPARPWPIEQCQHCGLKLAR